MVDFTNVLNKKVEEVEKPKPKPAGTYLAAINGQAQQLTRTVQGNERLILSFSLKLLVPQADVDSSDFADAGDIVSWPSRNHDIWIDSPEGEWQLRRFLTEVLKIEPGDKSFGEMIAEAPGLQLHAKIRHRPYTDRDGQPAIAWEIESVAAA